MSFLIDTNVISEVRKGERCHPNVARWYAKLDERDIFLSVLVLGEIRRGAERVRRRDPARARSIDAWLAAVTEGFANRILDVDRVVADEWGRIAALRPVPTVDALLAATATVHGLILATRNVADVKGTGAQIVNPFDPGSA